ncbi:hypothetical protein KIN20_024421 [Parelaphostrongylus tenuis]|uniref:Uncharacterized protein n=1 Tax=Parelaphostrongylus tenuis TaxID=148309 RepID=A0AAD5MTE9_PARTN|nr:hypothetical protein KIN20_024421 [Parelaphostrongylus tenuis]
MTNIIRLIQVTLQSGLILVGSKLVLNEDDHLMMRFKPGKQAGVTEEILRLYGSYYWAILIRGCSPPTIFYREACDDECIGETGRPLFLSVKEHLVGMRNSDPKTPLGTHRDQEHAGVLLRRQLLDPRTGIKNICARNRRSLLDT